MKILYIGQYSKGTTSHMRAEEIKKILSPDHFYVIDTHFPFYNTPRIWRTLGFRYKRGPLVSNTNRYCLTELEEMETSAKFDLVWVDKGIFLTPNLMKNLKARSKKIIHYTPDMAFYENKSVHFKKSIPFYDFLITTKRAEILVYTEHIPKEKIILTTQGFSKDVHYSKLPFEKKDNSVAFIGLAEKSRFEIIELLLQNNIKVRVAGMGWNKFANKHKENPNLDYVGSGIFSHEYSEFLSSSKFALGLLSKNFPEFHTTRTFEIPACGTALLTEKNIETSSFFSEDEAIFYSSPDELVEKIQFYLQNEKQLETLIQKGLDRVHNDARDYESLLSQILQRALPPLGIKNHKENN